MVIKEVSRIKEMHNCILMISIVQVEEFFTL